MLEQNKSVCDTGSSLPVAYLYYANMLIAAQKQDEALRYIEKALTLSGVMLKDQNARLVMDGKRTKAAALIYQAIIEKSRGNSDKEAQYSREAESLIQSVEKPSWIYLEARDQLLRKKS